MSLTVVESEYVENKALVRLFEETLREGEPRQRALKPLDDALRNKFPRPYLPSIDSAELEREYVELIDRSRLNVCRLVVAALVDRLHVIGFRIDQGSRSGDERVWSWWQGSKLDQRQSLLFSDAAGLADGYLLVTPNGDMPQFTPQSPLQLSVVNDPYNPLRVERAAKAVKNRGWLYTADAIYSFVRDDAYDRRWVLDETIPHAAGECPVVRFANDPDSLGRSMSEIETVLPVQNRIHQTVFDRLLLQRSQAWKQRWATDVTVERDENGNPINPFKTGADTILINESPEGKFGEFGQAELTGLIQAVDADLQAVALISRTPPYYLPHASISNISAEALTALDAAMESRVGERKVLWGEALEHANRIGGRMVGVDIPDEAEVVWADWELETEAQRSDAAVKLTSIGVPLEYVLERLGLTDEAIKRVMVMAKVEDTRKARAVAASYGVTGYGPAESA